MTPSQSRSGGNLSFTHHGSSEISFKSKEVVEYALEDFVRAWRLYVERKLWFEQSDEGSANKNNFSKEILSVFESLRVSVCRDSTLLRRQIPAHAAVFLTDGQPYTPYYTRNPLACKHSLTTPLTHKMDLPASPEFSSSPREYMQIFFRILRGQVRACAATATTRPGSPSGRTSSHPPAGDVCTPPPDITHHHTICVRTHHRRRTQPPTGGNTVRVHNTHPGNTIRVHHTIRAHNTSSLPPT
ncbi:hypothetical protein PSHT_11405 [Puccinia striiformis]|uniref:Uncharacterized protein n=1 Tax=Puccinia striiformis TaxID=27350 RepID=A0A2S4V3X8_9BASI|nr:hypothetical protein PSHT_11405 [Puccinia striiformis]